MICSKKNRKHRFFFHSHASFFSKKKVLVAEPILYSINVQMVQEPTLPIPDVSLFFAERKLYSFRARLPYININCRSYPPSTIIVKVSSSLAKP